MTVRGTGKSFLKLSLFPLILSYNVTLSALRSVRNISLTALSYHPAYIAYYYLFVSNRYDAQTHFLDKEIFSKGEHTCIDFLCNSGFKIDLKDKKNVEKLIDMLQCSLENVSLENDVLKEKVRRLEALQEVLIMQNMNSPRTIDLSFVTESTGVSTFYDTIEHLTRDKFIQQTCLPQRTVQQSISFNRKSNVLAMTGWNGMIDLYECKYQALSENLDSLETVAVHKISSPRSIVGQQNPALDILETDFPANYDIAFSLLEESLVAASSKSGEITFLNTSQATKQVLKAHKQDVTSISFKKDELYLASTSFDKYVKIWDVVAAKEVSRFSRNEITYNVCFCRNILLSNIIGGVGFDKTLNIFDIRDKKKILQCNIHDSEVIGLDFSTNGFYLATSSHDKTCKIFDLRQLSHQKPVKVFTTDTPLKNLSYSPDGNLLAVGGENGNCFVFNTRVNVDEDIINEHEDVCISVCWKNNATLVTCSHDKTVKIFEKPSRRSFCL